MRFLTCCFMSSALALPAAAQAVTFKPIIDLRLRYETVEQAGIAAKANAVTARARTGFELKGKILSALVESEGSFALDGNYFSGVNSKTAFPIVADPETLELNRAQLQFTGVPKTVITLGRQRINLDDQRFVGSVGWRNNEQTFDAVRAEWTGIKNLKADISYAWSDRTIWGLHGGANGFVQRPQSIGGDNFFVNLSYKAKYGTLTGFYYQVEEKSAVVALQRNSSATVGARFAGVAPLSKAVKLNYILSYAQQSDIAANPLDYSAHYLLAEGGLDILAWKLGGGVEQLSGDASVRTKTTGAAFAGGFAFQTPFATLHKFQGWADKLLTTPAAGVTDYYASAGYGWKKLGPIDALTATAVYHRFDSDVGSIHYGDEINLQLIAKVKKYTFLAKYADYRAKGPVSFTGDVNTKKFWLSAEWAF